MAKRLEEICCYYGGDGTSIKKDMKKRAYDTLAPGER